MDQNNPAAGQKRAIDVSGSWCLNFPFNLRSLSFLCVRVGDPRPSQIGHQGTGDILLESHIVS